MIEHLRVVEFSIENLKLVCKRASTSFGTIFAYYLHGIKFANVISGGGSGSASIFIVAFCATNYVYFSIYWQNFHSVDLLLAASFDCLLIESINYTISFAVVLTVRQLHEKSIDFESAIHTFVEHRQQLRLRRLRSGKKSPSESQNTYDGMISR